MDKAMRELILNSIFEAGYYASLLDVLREAADELGTQEVFYNTCEALGFDPQI